ncbi:MAG: lipid-A-disaccharide synthase [Neptuniibacter caesariensis]|uniref:Lipid-A-disaccharide synthase n=1 Tax=Neptuniibacter caesariensis TaxID=207954 RepID=A0A2G6JNI1_NEPCE|nr:MAG: lipid-A-disaccharide synthase [Neptuniibacter caesariensis]
MSKPLRIGIVAGEASGDILGSGLISELKKRHPELMVEGIGGELMISAGCRSHYSMERLSVMGLIEVLGRLPELLRVRKTLIKHFLDSPPDVFIGVDAPDFTLAIEGALKAAGIPTVHYVSPSVWAWKQKRIYQIKKTTDLVLSLFPFEAQYYAPTDQRIEFVGHPLATTIPASVDIPASRRRLAVADNETIIAILPGSRGSEVKYLARPFLETARWLSEHIENVRFIIPAVNKRTHAQLSQLLMDDFSDVNVQLVIKHSRDVMAISDAILIASGTATLEATILKKPMVVAYKMASLTYKLYSRMVKSRFISLPNLLADEPLVPEVLQDQVRPDILGPLVLKALQDQPYRKHLAERFSEIHTALQQNADQKAADAVELLLEERGII